MWEGVFDSQTEVVGERYAVVLNLESGNFSPLVGSVDSGRSIRIVGLVSGILIFVWVQAPITIYPREGIDKIPARGGHFLLGILFAV